MSNKILRLNINSQAVMKIAGLISNSVILAANTYLVGSGLRQNWQANRRQHVITNLQVAAEIATAAATLAKVITDTFEQHRDPAG